MRAADLSGSCGEAWDVSHIPRMSNAEKACVAAWFVHVPAAHPLWPRYLLGLISLGDIEGAPDAEKAYPEAEWEIGLWALDPDVGPNPENYWSWSVLVPENAAVQFHGCSAEKAVDTCMSVAEALVSGLLPAEPQDHRGGTERWQSEIQHLALRP